MYDPALGRWFNVDPLADAEHSISITPYHYVANNPLLNLDPDGNDWYSFTNEEGVETAVWREGDAASIEIDGTTYTNVGTIYNLKLEDGSTVHYDQNEVTNVFDAEETSGEALATEQYVQDFFGEDFDVEVIPGRTNEQINKEIVNFFWSWFGYGDPDVGPLAPPMIGPKRKKQNSSSNPAYKEHTKNKSKVRKGKHQKGQKRRNQKYNDKKRNNRKWKQNPNKS